MDGNSPVQMLKKLSSFSSSREEKHRAIERNLSLGINRGRNDKNIIEDGEAAKGEEPVEHEEQEQEHVQEEKNGDANNNNENEEEKATNEEELRIVNVKEPDVRFESITEDIDDFLSLLDSNKGTQEEPEDPPEIPASTIETFIEFVEKDIEKFESGKMTWSSHTDEHSLLTTIDRVSKLTTRLAKFSSHTKYNEAMNKSSSLLHHAMYFFEEELHTMLDDPRTKPESNNTSNSKTKSRPLSFARQHDRQHEPDHSVPPTQEAIFDESTYSAETIERLHGIAECMILAGYETECCQVYSIARRNAFEYGLASLSFEKHSMDDIIKMSWENLESEIVSWIKTFKHTIDISFTNEHELCNSIFAGHASIAISLFHNFARGIVIQLLSFPDAVAMTKVTTEKLFKVLDMYEALESMLPTIDTLLPVEIRQGESTALTDIKSEVLAVQCRLGEAAVQMFCEIENTIKSDAGKAPVQGGAVHPLTRNVMNYLKNACDYKNTLEHIFRKFKNTEKYDDEVEERNQQGRGNQHNNTSRAISDNPLVVQMVEIMDLLHTTMEGKSKLFKDPALCNIFLMNNGRYAMQKIRASFKMKQLLGDIWNRKRSSALQQYHKNYQRETWSKVLACFKEDGLIVKGNLQRSVLKERFKSFNSMLEDIHKTQSSWIVSDEQLQSELRVSIAAVVVPAYRSFVGKYSQHFSPGRQTEKYIKFGGDDLENYIDELFDGNPYLVSKRRS